MRLSLTFPLTLRLLWRDARAGELRLLAAALVIAVAAFSAVGFFTDRVREALETEAHQLLGADLLLVADHPWPDAARAAARRQGLTLAETVTFPSMVSAGQGAGAVTQLADIKAATANYPLRGRLRIADGPGLPDREAQDAPAPGSAWLEERLATGLGVAVGDTVSVGGTRLRVAALLTLEPDKGVNFFALAPRLLMSQGDLAATGLLQEGSRASYRLMAAGPAARIAVYRDAMEKHLGRGERLEDARSARPEIRSALDRAQKFLGLAALLSVALAAAGVGLAARRYVQRHLDPCAILRCLGVTQGRLLALYAGQLLALAALASLAGVALGFVAHYGLYRGLAGLIPAALPAPSWRPAAAGLACGFVLLFGFAGPPLLQLRRVSTLRVIRRELGAPEGGALGIALAGLAALFALMVWVAGELKLAAFVAGGLLGAVLLFALAARGLVAFTGRLARAVPAAGWGWRQGLVSLSRHQGAVVVQIVALSLGVTALLLLSVTRADLVAAWRQAAPADAPNRFVVNIQPEQRQAVARFMDRAGLGADLAPMVRGRLTDVSGRPVSAADYAEERAQRLVEREFNLSYAADLPAGNTITAGRWFAPGEKKVASVEEGLAKILGLKVGDDLTFSIAGEPVTVKIVGLRRLNWDSMRVNFFVLTPPGVLEPYPASWITSFHLPDERTNATAALVRAFPNLTVIDVGAILRQIQSMLDQVVQAVQFVFLFTVAAGLVVLYGALVSAFDERRRELAVMRALGARSAQLRRSLMAEFAAVGALSGLLSAVAAQTIGWVVARQVFDLDLAVKPWLPVAAAIALAVLVSAAASLGIRRLLQTPAVDALRSE